MLRERKEKIHMYQVFPSSKKNEYQEGSEKGQKEELTSEPTRLRIPEYDLIKARITL